MYNKIECVTLYCDNCNEQYMNDHSGFSIFVSEADANDEADNDGWHLHGDDDKHYCPECFTIDENDNLVIRKKIIL